MNIARSLDKPPVPRSKKRRRVRRIKFAFRVFVLLACLLSAGFALYWTIIGIGTLWRVWGAPAVSTTWLWLESMSSAERFMWLNRFGWGAVGFGLLTSIWAYAKGARFAKWAALACFTYTYAFLWYTLWLVMQSFFDMNGWTENGLIGLAVLSYVYFVGQTRVSRSTPVSEETP